MTSSQAHDTSLIHKQLEASWKFADIAKQVMLDLEADPEAAIKTVEKLHLLHFVLKYENKDNNKDNKLEIDPKKDEIKNDLQPVIDPKKTPDDDATFMRMYPTFQLCAVKGCMEMNYPDLPGCGQHHAEHLAKQYVQNMVKRPPHVVVCVSDPTALPPAKSTWDISVSSDANCTCIYPDTCFRLIYHQNGNDDPHTWHGCWCFACRLEAARFKKRVAEGTEKDDSEE